MLLMGANFWATYRFNSSANPILCVHTLVAIEEGKESWRLEEEAMQKSLRKARAALWLLSTHGIEQALAGKLQALIL